MKRLTFTPDELASGLNTLQQAGKVEGMFLSSGIIKGSVTTQDKIIDTAEIVRKRYHYRGYLHLKVMPGIEYDQLYRLMQLADRVSVNLEGPTQERLDALAPKKDFQRELLRMLQLAEQIRRTHPYEKLAGRYCQLADKQNLWHTDGMKTNTSAPNYKGFRFPPEIIAHAVWLYFRFSASVIAMLRNFSHSAGSL